MNYKFQFSNGNNLDIPERLNLKEENAYAQKLWNGADVPEDKGRALEILEHLSKEFHDPRAMNNLAWIYETGGIVRRNRNKAMDLYIRAMFSGDALALSNLADKDIFCDVECMDVLEGFSFAYTAAQMHEENAMLTLAYCYIKGLGVDSDLEAARNLLQKAGYGFGELPHYGNKFGVTPNPMKIRCLREAILDMKDRILESPFEFEPVTETVWVSPGLEFYPEVFSNLKDALESRGIPFRLLPGEKNKKHVWARDYMPVQVGRNRYVQQTYAPDYLADDPSYIPDYRKIASEVKPGMIIPTKRIIDGGNVLIEGRSAIMTDKVFYENPGVNSSDFISELERLFGVDSFYIMPWDMSDPYGHADGMVRFIDESTLVINNFSGNERMGRRIKRFLGHYFNIKNLHFEGKLTNSLNWGYINFLKVGERLFVPQFGIQEDSQALEQLGIFFPDSEIIPIFGCQSLARDGGVLNCVTWTTKQYSDEHRRNKR